jgi:3-methylcrotonyl-CoA carboxylase alpha subunit
MFDSILIANRGEIACRIARTARGMGIRTIAVYSDADAGAMHVAACDEARRIGPAPPRELSRWRGDHRDRPGHRRAGDSSRLRLSLRKRRLRRSRRAAGLVFIGPPPVAIRAMGSKSEAKLIMGRAGFRSCPATTGSSRTMFASRARRTRSATPC